MRDSKCSYFGNCGGCANQNITYEKQIQDKKQILEDALSVIDYNKENIPIKVFQGDEFFYRNRMDMVVHTTGIGQRKKGIWYEVVDIKECVIAEKKLNFLIKEIREFFKDNDAFHLKEKTGTFMYAVIRTADTTSISFVLNVSSPDLEKATEKIKEFAKKTICDNILIAYVPKNSGVSISEDYIIVKGKDFLKQTYIDKTFFYSVQGFFQNNHKMAEQMQMYCKNILKTYNTKNSLLLDLYGGVGTFGIINSDLFKNVLTVENHQQSIDSAIHNALINNIKNLEALVLDAKYIKNLEYLQKAYINFENVFTILDPPRSGMNKRTIKYLNILKPEVIIYISCNLKELKKDLPKFVDYELKSAALFDLFPQTPHCEGIVELKLKNK